ncbi:sporulation protein YjcZ [Cohnella caldifontis]|nr:sporulation protein YjcZ [Cohnella sp. YIM B05605]
MGFGVGGVGFSCAGFGSAIGFVLVLFILLVIILSAGFFI